MIAFNTIFESAKKAYCNNEMFEFLTGRKGYNLPVVDAQVDVPTDWTRIIPFGVYALYVKDNDKELVKMFEAAIIKALNGKAQDIWAAAHILYIQMDKQKQDKAHFFIDGTLCSILHEKMENSKRELSKYYPYGKNDWNMYEDIFRLNSN